MHTPDYSNPCLHKQELGATAHATTHWYVMGTAHEAWGNPIGLDCSDGAGALCLPSFARRPAAPYTPLNTAAPAHPTFYLYICLAAQPWRRR